MRHLKQDKKSESDESTILIDLNRNCPEEEDILSKIEDDGYDDKV